jgi:hypothetical protein
MLALFTSAGASAQDTIMYRGGKGDGFDRVSFSNFSPALLNNNVAYAGGKGDGYGFEKVSNFALSLLNNNVAYAGSKGDGYGFEKLSNFSPVLINNNVAYAGAKGDGHAVENVSNFAPTFINNFVAYTGANGDGYSSDSKINFNRTMINNYFAYAGGVGDGWSNNLAISVSLPLVLLSFEGTAMDSYNALRWKTSIEENVDYFLVEKSKDGMAFASIGNVNAVGNSLVEQEYTFDDKRDVQGISYYKLRMTDMDETYTYSKVIKLINEKLDYSVTLAPNPASQNISIRLSRALDKPSEFAVFDMSGKVVLKQRIDKDEAVKNIDIQALVPGQYMIYLNLANDKMSLPFMKR